MVCAQWGPLLHSCSNKNTFFFFYTWYLFFLISIDITPSFGRSLCLTHTHTDAHTAEAVCSSPPVLISRHGPRSCLHTPLFWLNEKINELGWARGNTTTFSVAPPPLLSQPLFYSLTCLLNLLFPSHTSLFNFTPLLIPVSAALTGLLVNKDCVVRSDPHLIHHPSLNKDKGKGNYPLITVRKAVHLQNCCSNIKCF